MSEILVKVYRDKLVESIHRGDIAVVDKSNKDLYGYGDNRKITYWRSAAKPLQVLPLIFTGVAEKYDFTEKELALMAASHSGEKIHTEVIKEILSKIGLDQTYLKCGIHPPIHKKTAREIWQAGEEPEPIHNNCSGKHCALLSLCKHYGWPLDSYYEINHPVQKLITKTISEVTEVKVNNIYYGEDGCGVIVFGLPIRNMAYAYARLANPQLLSPKYRDASRIITSCMEKYPEMVAGTGRFNTELMKVTGNKLIAKSGAQGVFCIGVHDKMGITIKVEDGNKRAIPPVVVQILSKLNIISTTEKKRLKKYRQPRVTNNLNHKVGEVVPEFELNII